MSWDGKGDIDRPCWILIWTGWLPNVLLNLKEIEHENHVSSVTGCVVRTFCTLCTARLE
jgi:hypothetical protein